MLACNSESPLKEDGSNAPLLPSVKVKEFVMTPLGKELRMSEIFAKDKKIIILDTSFISITGSPDIFLNFKDGLKKVLNFADAIILNQGDLRDFLKLKIRIPVILRINWTNILRGKVPAPQIHLLFSPHQALYSGASAVISYFILGYDDEFEKDNIKMVSNLFNDCLNLNLPLFCDLKVQGEKITKENFDSAIKLGCSLLSEIGVDAISIPYSNKDTFNSVKELCRLNLLIDDGELEEISKSGSRESLDPVLNKIDEILSLEINGILLGVNLFKRENYIEILEKISQKIKA